MCIRDRSKRRNEAAQTNFDWETSANSSGVRPEVSSNEDALPKPEGKSMCSWAGWMDCDMVTRMMLENVNSTSFLELGIYGNMISPNDQVETHRA